MFFKTSFAVFGFAVPVLFFKNKFTDLIQCVHTGQNCFLKNIILFLKCSFDVARLFFKNNVVAGFEPGTFAASVSVTALYRCEESSPPWEAASQGSPTPSHE